jgi:hypothetical protein
VFEQPVAGITPARLPTLGLFDTLKSNAMLAATTYTAVGYGGQERSVDDKGKPYIADEDKRENAVSSFGSLNPAWLRLSQNSATGDAGTTITGDSQCVLSNMVYRLDTESARAFLKDYVTLP